jgi:transcriptional antiterminator NusG
VTDGPLVGREGDVVKINRHKREAVVAIPFMGDVVRVTLPLEIVSKTGKSDAEADEPDKDI